MTDFGHTSFKTIRFNHTYTVWPRCGNSPVFLVTSKHPVLLSLDVAGRMWWFLTGRGHSGAGWERDFWVTVAPMGMNSPDNWLVCGITFSVTIAWPLGALGRSGSIRCTTTFFGRTARPRRLQYRGRNFCWRQTTDFYQLWRQRVDDLKETWSSNNADGHVLNYLMIPSQLHKSHGTQSGDDRELLCWEWRNANVMYCNTLLQTASGGTEKNQKIS